LDLSMNRDRYYIAAWSVLFAHLILVPDHAIYKIGNRTFRYRDFWVRSYYIWHSHVKLSPCDIYRLTMLFLFPIYPEICFLFIYCDQPTCMFVSCFWKITLLSYKLMIKFDSVNVFPEINCICFVYKYM
jgi:hypothetical protein